MAHWRRRSAAKRALWDDELWTNIEAIGESDVLALRESARSGTGWDGVHQWQKTLAAYRGGDSLERRFVPPTYGSVKPPAFGLLAVESLFSDGLLESSPE